MPRFKSVCWPSTMLAAASLCLLLLTSAATGRKLEQVNAQESGKVHKVANAQELKIALVNGRSNVTFTKNITLTEDLFHGMLTNEFHKSDIKHL
jgi:hypothetical protein